MPAQFVRSPARTAGLPLMKTFDDPSATASAASVVSPLRAASCPPTLTLLLPLSMTEGVAAGNAASSARAAAKLVSKVATPFKLRWRKGRIKAALRLVRMEISASPSSLPRHVRVKAAIIIESAGLLENETSRLVRLNVHVPAAGYGGRVRDKVLVYPHNGIATLRFYLRRGVLKIADRHLNRICPNRLNSAPLPGR